MNWKNKGPRYGMDELGKLILIIAIVFWVLGLLLQVRLVMYVGVVAFIYFVTRIFSRRIYERSEENRRYLNWKKVQKLRYEQRKEYKIFVCKSCGRTNRVPKGKGKIEITCPVCGNKVIKRT